MRSRLYFLIAFLIFPYIFLSESESDNKTGSIRGKVQVLSSGNPANVVVYIKNTGNMNFPPPEKHAIMDQKNLTFIPHVLPVLKGTTVDFLNSDHVKHNVFSPDRIARRFNLGTYGKGEKRSHTFNKAGDAVILCNVHPEMEAYVVVLPNPFFAITDEEGYFHIKNVPAGQYTIRTWHEKLRGISKKITVESGKTTQLHIILKER